MNERTTQNERRAARYLFLALVSGICAALTCSAVPAQTIELRPTSETPEERRAKHDRITKAQASSAIVDRLA